MNKVSNYCLALRFVFDELLRKYYTFAEPKNNYKWQLNFWLRNLISLCNYESDVERVVSMGLREIQKLEPSEITFLSSVRRNLRKMHNLNLSDERLVYKTLLHLLK